MRHKGGSIHGLIPRAGVHRFRHTAGSCASSMISCRGVVGIFRRLMTCIQLLMIQLNDTWFGDSYHLLHNQVPNDLSSRSHNVLRLNLDILPRVMISACFRSSVKHMYRILPN